MNFAYTVAVYFNHEENKAFISRYNMKYRKKPSKRGEKRSKKKTVTLEIYELNKLINFTISNTYKELVPLKEMKRKGFTTKGSNHGKGLYYANKILNKTKWIESEQIFLNKYFIQKIVIKKFVK